MYRMLSNQRRAIWAGPGVVIAGLLLVLVYLLRAEVFASSATDGASLPVAVFNATSTPGAAHDIAGELGAGRVRIGEIGNISTDLGKGVYVFYPSGAQAEAQRVARLLPTLTPRVAPVEPQIQTSVGRQRESLSSSVSCRSRPATWVMVWALTCTVTPAAEATFQLTPAPSSTIERKAQWQRRTSSRDPS